MKPENGSEPIIVKPDQPPPKEPGIYAEAVSVLKSLEPGGEITISKGHLSTFRKAGLRNAIKFHSGPTENGTVKITRVA